MSCLYIIVQSKTISIEISERILVTNDWKTMVSIVTVNS